MSVKLKEKIVDGIVFTEKYPIIPLKKEDFIHDGKRSCPFGLDYAVQNLKSELINIQEDQKSGFADISEQIENLSERILDPDKGLYARLKGLESHRAALSKLTWIVLTAFTSAITAIIVRYLVN